MPTAYPLSQSPYISLSRFYIGMEIDPINQGLLDRTSGGGEGGGNEC